MKNLPGTNLKQFQSVNWLFVLTSAFNLLVDKINVLLWKSQVGYIVILLSRVRLNHKSSS